MNDNTSGTEFDFFSEEEPNSTVERRSANKKASPLTMIAAVGGFIVLSAGAFMLFQNNDDGPGQGVSAFASGDRNLLGQMVIRTVDEDADDKEPIISNLSPDNTLELKHQQEIAALKQQIGSLQADLKISVSKVEALDESLKESRNLLKQADRRQATAIKNLEKIKDAEIKAVREASQARIKQLESDLEVATSLGQSLTDAERERLAEAAKLRQEAIESEAVIFDSGTEENKIRY
ncbi:MAG: hypothetical protein AAF429_09195 [Pseudomonadota bacterium]